MAHYIDPGMCGGVFRPPIGDYVLTFVPEFFELRPDEFRTGPILFAGRIDRWNARQPTQEIDHLIGDSIHSAKDCRFMTERMWTHSGGSKRPSIPVHPPSTNKTVPVTKLLAGEARKAMGQAIFSGWAQRFKALRLA